MTIPLVQEVPQSRLALITAHKQSSTDFIGYSACRIKSVYCLDNYKKIISFLVKRNLGESAENLILDSSDISET